MLFISCLSCALIRLIVCFIYCLVVFGSFSDFFWLVFIFLTLLLPGGRGVLPLTSFPLPVLPPFSDDDADDDCDGGDDDRVGCDSGDGDGGGVGGGVDDDGGDDGGNVDGGVDGEDADGSGRGDDADGNDDDDSTWFPISILTLLILEGGILVEGGGLKGVGIFCCPFSKNSKFSIAFLLT